MRNYIILNGQISTNIQGLLISELPPITKPAKRTQIEEIDGRDGDIVTDLGYSAYNKEFTIGLYGDFDIDEVIQYFNTEGTVTFSNEEDKYYKYQILEQIDFERLIRFRTATVTMHVQPFKYSLTDNEKTYNIDNQLLSFSNWTSNKNNVTLTASNGSITINGTATIDTSTNNVEFYLPINELNLDSGSYTLSALANGTGAENVSVSLVNNTSCFADNSLQLEDNNTVQLNGTLTENTTYNYLYFSIPKGSEVDFTVDINFANDPPIGNITIRNVGNIYAKPIITINGSGTITIALNNQDIFNIDLINTSSITIDTALMEAYNETQLLNRLVTGDYDNCKFQVGNNVITWTGNVTSIELQNFSRWI